MMIKIKDRKKIDLILWNVLYTSELYSNLIYSENIQFRTKSTLWNKQYHTKIEEWPDNN